MNTQKNSSNEIADEFLNQIIEDCPSFLVAHNGYKFDNCVLGHHLAMRGSRWNQIFEPIRMVVISSTS